MTNIKELMNAFIFISSFTVTGLLIGVLSAASILLLWIPNPPGWWWNAAAIEFLYGSIWFGLSPLTLFYAVGGAMFGLIFSLILWGLRLAEELKDLSQVVLGISVITLILFPRVFAEFTEVWLASYAYFP